MSSCIFKNFRSETHFFGPKIGACLVSTNIYFGPGRPNFHGQSPYMSPTYPQKMSPLAQSICEHCHFKFGYLGILGHFIYFELKFPFFGVKIKFFWYHPIGLIKPDLLIQWVRCFTKKSLSIMVLWSFYPFRPPF